MASAFTKPGPKRTTAWALLYRGKPAGKLVADQADVVCTCSVLLWDGKLYDPMADTNSHTGTASGGGYHKLSAAFADALLSVDPRVAVVDSAGSSAVVSYLNGCGYTVVEVLS